MKRILTVIFATLASVSGFAQAQPADTLREVIDQHTGKLNALDERVLINESDLSKLTKIKVSGYIQAQWENYQTDLYKPLEPSNTFYIRRARVKFTYEPADGVKFVLQPDFSTGNLSLKDAYGIISFPGLKTWSLWAGQMNRPDYEVEYSSGQREVLERSKVIRAIYPGEREVGAKLEYNGSSVPLKFQLMAMNGNFAKGSEQKDVDSKKDIMGRLVYSASIPSAGLGIDFGVNGYFGGVRSKSNQYVSRTSGELDSLTVGDYLKKQWFGSEIQIYADVLGGLAIKGEYIFGTNGFASTIASSSTSAQKKADPNKIREFAGYYIYLIKNIGKKNQAVLRYDFYDPNTKLSGDAAGSDVSYKTLALAWQYYLNDNIRVSLNYEMPVNEETASVKNASGTAVRQLKDNVFGIRVQAKF